MERELKNKLKQATQEILRKARQVARENQGNNVNQEQVIEEAIEREAEEKARKIYEYLEEFVFNRLDRVEGRVANLENRIQTLGSPSPTNTTITP